VHCITELFSGLLAAELKTRRTFGTRASAHIRDSDVRWLSGAGITVWDTTLRHRKSILRAFCVADPHDTVTARHLFKIYILFTRQAKITRFLRYTSISDGSRMCTVRHYTVLCGLTFRVPLRHRTLKKKGCVHGSEAAFPRLGYMTSHMGGRTSRPMLVCLGLLGTGIKGNTRRKYATHANAFVLQTREISDN
jgi:hypothetical protein